MKDRIKNMYASVFCAENKCAYFKECVSKMTFTDDCSFVCNHNIKLGDDYEKEKMRIVIIGKEPREKERSESVLNPESFLETVNQHYVRTKFIVGALLDLISEEVFKSYKGNIISFDKEGELHKKFALTNHYHCAFKKDNKAHGVKTTQIMWRNCAEIVKKEIEILRPDIIVIQAGWSVNFKKSKEDREQTVGCYFGKEWKIKELYAVNGLYIAEKGYEKCVIIGSYHPCYHWWHKSENLDMLKKRITVAKRIVALYK